MSLTVCAFDKVSSCISSRTCPNCKVELVCDSGIPPKAGTRVGNIRYVQGPCCCGMGKCPECGYDWYAVWRERLTSVYISPEALAEIKMWDSEAE